MAEGAWGPWGPIYNALQMGDVQLQQAQATMQDTRALAGLRQLEVALANNRLQSQQATQQAFARSLAGSATTQVGSTIDNPDDTPLDLATKQAKRLQDQAQLWANASNEILKTPNGDPVFAQKLMADSVAASFRSRQMLMEARLEQQGMAKQMGGIAAAALQADTDAGFQTALQQMRVIDPKVDTRYAWDRDGAGKPIRGDNSTGTLSALQQGGMGGEKALDLSTKLANEKSLAQERTAKIAEDNARKAELDSRTALNRAKTPGTPEYAAAADVEDKVAKRQEAARLSKLANAVPSKDMVSAADEDIKAYVATTFKGATFDPESRKAFANDVAAKANTLKAQNPELSMDDARFQAIEILKPFIVDKVKAKEPYFSGNDYLPTIGGQPAVKMYRRSSTLQPELDQAAATVKAAAADPNPEGKANPKPAAGAYRTQRNGVWGWAVPQ